MHFRNRPFRRTCHAKDEQNSRRPTSSTDRPNFQLTCSFEHLQVLQPRTRRTLVSYSSNSPTLDFSQRLFVNAFRPLSAKSWVRDLHSLPSFGVPRLPLCDGCACRMFLCSTEIQKCSPLSWPITHPSAMPCSLSSQPWAECQCSSVRSAMSHILKPTPGAQHANLVSSRMDAMCIARPKI